MKHGQPIDGHIVLRERLRQGLTLRELAERCAANGYPIAFSQLSRIERGLSQPSARILPVLAKALGIEVDDMFASDGSNGGAAA